MTESAHDTPTPNGPTLGWRHDEAAERIDSEQALVRRLEEIGAANSEQPPLVTLAMTDGSWLAVGVGRDYSIVNYVKSIAEPDYLSEGDLAVDEPPVFYFDGHYSEFPPDAAVSVEDAYEAMRRFYRTGERPDNISWR
jgi:Immunity protein Imm1